MDTITKAPTDERWYFASGNQKLGSRVESIADNKRATERRIAEVHQHFAQLASIRSEIASAFADLNSALNKFG